MLSFSKRLLVVGAVASAVGLAALPNLSAMAVVAHSEEVSAYVKPSQSFESAGGSPVVVTRDGWSIQDLTVVQWPVPHGIMSSGFGYRTDAPTQDHRGIDLNPGNGYPVSAIAYGVVVGINWELGLGNSVLIRHMVDGVVVDSGYGHMQDGSVTVAVGDVVSAGDIIGLVGSTGISTGAHLHFEIHIDGVAVDPTPWMAVHENAEAWDWLNG